MRFDKVSYFIRGDVSLVQTKADLPFSTGPEIGMALIQNLFPFFQRHAFKYLACPLFSGGFHFLDRVPHILRVSPDKFIFGFRAHFLPPLRNLALVACCFL